jgi:hypothetical protein
MTSNDDYLAAGHSESDAVGSGVSLGRLLCAATPPEMGNLAAGHGPIGLMFNR